MTALLISQNIVGGCDGYTYAARLTKAWTQGALSRMWLLGVRPVSAQLAKRNGGGLWKGLDRMNDLSYDLLDQLEAVGVRHPSSYADCFHQLAPGQKRVKHSYNGMFSWWRGGPWAEALNPGVKRGQWFRYDIRSAYRWAATLGLPDMSTVRAWKKYRYPEDANGLWVGYVETRKDLPNVYRRAVTPVVISSEELRTYKLQCDVLYGVTWDATHPPNYIDATLDRLPCAKQSARAYWGRWIARDPLVCKTKERTWTLPNRTANFIWGWLIVGRVRLKVWEHARYAAHVYVDEVVVPHELPSGNGVGDWQLKEHFARGVCVNRTGWYSALGGQTIMQTGVAA